MSPKPFGVSMCLDQQNLVWSLPPQLGMCDRMIGSWEHVVVSI